MKRNFGKLSQFLAEQFPELQGRIRGAAYPVAPMVELMSNLMTLVQLVGILWGVMGGESFLRMLGLYKNRPMPSWYFTIQQNGIQIAIFLYLILPQIVAKFMQNGAFEIFLDEKEIFSKLQTGKLPQAEALVETLKAAGLEHVVPAAQATI